MRHILALAILLSLLPALAQAQLSRADQVRKTILDATEVMHACEDLPNFSTQAALFKGKFDDLTRSIGLEQSYFPITTRDLQGETLAAAEKICADLLKLLDDCRKKALAAPDETEEWLAQYVLRSPNPGCYYLGLNDGPLCDNALRTQLTMLALQDYPFEDAASGDPCLWEIPQQVPNAEYLVLFATDLHDELLADLHLEQLSKLKVVSLSENGLTTIPAFAKGSKTLRYLDLAKNKISALPQDLKPYAALVHLDLRGNPLPEAEKARVKAALPGTLVKF